MLFVVRHAKAGSRRNWHDDDRLRPLTKTGRHQAEAIGRRLAGMSTGGRLLSSPYLRCLQTLEPLAARTERSVEPDERLAEGADTWPVLALLAELADGSALCSHGDLIPDVMQALQRRGMMLRGTADWRKGSVWALERHDGEITEATAWAPPDV